MTKQSNNDEYKDDNKKVKNVLVLQDGGSLGASVWRIQELQTATKMVISAGTTISCINAAIIISHHILSSENRDPE